MTFSISQKPVAEQVLQGIARAMGRPTFCRIEHHPQLSVRPSVLVRARELQQRTAPIESTTVKTINKAASTIDRICKTIDQANETIGRTLFPTAAIIERINAII